MLANAEDLVLIVEELVGHPGEDSGLGIHLLGVDHRITDEKSTSRDT